MFKKAVILGFTLLIASCGLFSSKEKSAPKGPKMVTLTKNAVAYLGSNDSMGLTAAELPLTVSPLDYTFSLSKAEITQAEFQEFMGVNTVPADHPQYGAKNPVILVSWYQAALFCNALSKANNYDTVYSYTTISDGGVLEDLFTDFTQNGYRLPTEAEWNFAAQTHKGHKFPWGSDTAEAPKYANFFPHANGKLRPVCRGKTTGAGFCDLGGNALEWVQDWLQALPGDTVRNFLGGLEKDLNSDKVVKGGSFQHGVHQMRSSLRTDNYFAPPYQATEYIGFRVARGSITSGNYQSDQGSVAQTQSSIKLVAKLAEIRAFFKTRSVKLVAVDGQNNSLVRVDLARQLVLPVLQDGADVRHPEISPDGKHIAYANRSEGQGGALQLGVLNFNSLHTNATLPNAAMPRWHQNNEQLELIYVDNIQNNEDSLNWLQHRTHNIVYENGAFAPATTPLNLNGAYHSGFSDDVQYLASGYTRLRVLDRANDKLKTYFTYPQNGKDPDASIQVCNASISSGENPEIAFIDFGYAQKSNIVGKSYGIHEVIFIMDPATGEVKDYIPTPAGYSGWNFPEWSNHPDYLIATAFDNSDANKAVFAIRRSDKQVLQLLSGDEINTPQLWIDHRDLHPNWEPFWDSAFNYSEPADNINRFYMEQKLLRGFMNREKVRTLTFGSSRMGNGFIAAQYAGADSGTVINMGFPGGVNELSSFLIENYARLNIYPNLERIIVDLGLELFASYGFTDHIIAPTWGFNYDMNHNFFAEGFNSAIDSALDIRYAQILNTELGLEYGTYGDIVAPGHWNCLGYGSTIFDIDMDWTTDKHWQQNFKMFKQMVNTMTERQVAVYGVVFPQHPGYVDTEYYGRHGGERPRIAALVDSLNALAASNSNFKWHDFNQNGSHNYPSEYFNDADHLCGSGAEAITQEIKAWIESDE